MGSRVLTSLAALLNRFTTISVNRQARHRSASPRVVGTPTATSALIAVCVVALRTTARAAAARSARLEGLSLIMEALLRARSADTSHNPEIIWEIRKSVCFARALLEHAGFPKRDYCRESVRFARALLDRAGLPTQDLRWRDEGEPERDLQEDAAALPRAVLTPRSVAGPIRSALSSGGERVAGGGDVRAGRGRDECEDEYTDEYDDEEEEEEETLVTFPKEKDDVPASGAEYKDEYDDEEEETEVTFPKEKDDVPASGAGEVQKGWLDLPGGLQTWVDFDENGVRWEFFEGDWHSDSVGDRLLPSAAAYQLYPVEWWRSVELVKHLRHEVQGSVSLVEAAKFCEVNPHSMRVHVLEDEGVHFKLGNDNGLEMVIPVDSVRRKRPRSFTQRRTSGRWTPDERATWREAPASRARRKVTAASPSPSPRP